MSKGSLVTHRQTQNGVAKGGLGSGGGGVDVSNRVNDPRTYRVEFTAQAGHMSYPVKGCSGRASMRTAMRIHFCHRHIRYTLLILD